MEIPSFLDFYHGFPYVFPIPLMNENPASETHLLQRIPESYLLH
jgi:hypothetical protein